MVSVVKWLQFLDVTCLKQHRFNIYNFAWNMETIIPATDCVRLSAFTESNADGRVFQPLHVEVEYKNPEAFFYGPFGLAIALRF